MRLAVLLCVLLGPAAARAEAVPDQPYCLLCMPLRSDIDKYVAAAIVATAAAATTIATMKTNPPAEKPLPVGVEFTTDSNGRKQARLKLIPTPPPVPQRSEVDPYGGYRPQNLTFRFNDTATNVVLAVGGAAVLTSVIVGLLGKK